VPVVVWRIAGNENMTRLILTTDASGAGGLKGARRAGIVIPFDPRFVWGPLPSEANP
jgi:hypothetical protein